MNPMNAFRMITSVALAGIMLSPLAADDRRWFDRVLLGMETGPTGAQFGNSDPDDRRFAAKFDGREIVRRARDAGSEYLVMWVRDGDYAYYQSSLLRKAPGLGSRDPLREAMEEAGKSGLPVISYCVVQQGGHFLKEHPEWEMRGADGKPLGRFCFNSGYLEAMKQILSEQMAYGIAGFHIDMLDHGFGPPYGCWCEACQREFAAEHGHAMPSGPTWDEAWDRMLSFRYRSSERFEKALAAHVRSLHPQATVDFNYHGNPPFSFEVGQRPVQHAGNGDFVTGETGVWGFSALTVGLNAQFYRAAAPGQRVQVAMQRGVRMYHDQTTRPLEDIRWELLTLLAHGAFVTMVDKTAFDGSLDPVAYERIGAAFADAARRRAHFGHAPVADVGIYFSSRSRDWMGRGQPSEWFRSFLGAHKALAGEHIPHGIIPDENADTAALQRYPVILVPHAGVIAESEARLLRGYVSGGGKLILTGWPGCQDRLGNPQDESSLAELCGGSFVRRLASLDNWMRLNADDLAAAAFPVPGLRADWPFLVKGPAAVWKAHTATPLGQLLEPHRTTRQREGKEGTDWPMSADAPVGPAMLRNRFGAGEVITFCGSPDYAVASEHGIAEARRLLRAAVRLLHPQPRLEIDAPVSVEAVVTDDAASRTLRIHLLGYHAPPQTMPVRERPYVLPALMEDRPVFRAVIRLRDEPQSVQTINADTVLRRDGQRIELLVSDVHETVLVKY